MMENSEIRRGARSLYKQHFLLLITSYTLFFIITNCLVIVLFREIDILQNPLQAKNVFILFINTFLSYFISSFFTIGIFSMLLNLWNNKKASIQDIFTYIHKKNFCPGVITLTLFLLVMEIILNYIQYIPIFFIMHVTPDKINYNEYNSGRLIGIVLQLAFLWLYLRFYLTRFLFINGYSKKLLENVSESWKKMKGKVYGLFCMFLSVTWYLIIILFFVAIALYSALDAFPQLESYFKNPVILSIFVGIPYALLNPYIQLSITGLINEILNEEKDSQPTEIIQAEPDLEK